MMNRRRLLILVPLWLAACDLSDPAPRIERLADSTRTDLAREIGPELADLRGQVRGILAQLDASPLTTLGRMTIALKPTAALLELSISGDTSIQVARDGRSEAGFFKHYADLGETYDIRYAPGPGLDSSLDPSLDLSARYQAARSLSPSRIVTTIASRPGTSIAGGGIRLLRETVDADQDGRIDAGTNRHAKIGFFEEIERKDSTNSTRVLIDPGADLQFADVADNHWFLIEQCTRYATGRTAWCTELVADDTARGVPLDDAAPAIATWRVRRGLDTILVASVSFSRSETRILSIGGWIEVAGAPYSIRSTTWSDVEPALVLLGPVDSIRLHFTGYGIDPMHPSLAGAARRRIHISPAPWATTTTEWLPDHPAQAMSAGATSRFALARQSVSGWFERIEGRATTIAGGGNDSMSVTVERHQAQ